jgi:hypothetical protein
MSGCVVPRLEALATPQTNPGRKTLRRLVQCLIQPPRRPSAAGRSRTARASAKSGATGPATAITKQCERSAASMRPRTGKRALSGTGAKLASASRVAGSLKAGSRHIRGDEPIPYPVIMNQNSFGLLAELHPRERGLAARPPTVLPCGG